jgi:cyanophycin synthetase
LVDEGMIEVRVLEGPNIHFSEPAVELTIDARLLEDSADPERLLEMIARRAGVDVAARTTRLGDDIVLLAFTWEQRGKAEALADGLARLLREHPGDWEDHLEVASRAVRDVDPGDGPEAIDPPIPVVAVTGTNGKTTVTRLLAHIGRVAGLRVSWCNTDGIFLDGVTLDEGDWSGPGGARGAVTAEGAQLAILEVARGGLLRSGMGVTLVDVAVVTNVSADHLGEYHVTDLDRLAEVKTSILSAVRPDGWAVVNAEDARVFARRGRSPGRVFAFSTDPSAAGLRQVLDAGGRVATVEDGWVIVEEAGDVAQIVRIAEVPVSLAGLSGVNISNALAAAAAAIGLGLSTTAVAEGLRSFNPDPSQNPGRMNIWELDDRIVVVDYAHNAESLQALVEVLRALAAGTRSVWLLVGTAGDRTDDLLEHFAEIGARGADRLGITEKEEFLRGRTNENMNAILRRGAARGGCRDVPVFPDELTGLETFHAEAAPGDVVAVCAHAQREEIFAWLAEQDAVPVDNQRLRTLAS